MPVQSSINTRIQISAAPGLTLYTFVVPALGSLPTSDVWASSALALQETIPNSGEYFGTFPDQSQAGLYLLPIFVQSGSSPASADLQLGVWQPQATDNNTPAPLPANGAMTLAIDWDTECGIRSMSRLGAAPGGPRPEVLPQPQNSVVTAQRILSALYKAREDIASSGSFVNVNIDGQAFTYSSISQIEQSIYFWERKVARLSGRRRRVNTLRLDCF